MTHAELSRADRVSRILAVLDAMGERTEAMLRHVDNDATWFMSWTLALGIGARCPSHATRQAVREAVRSRLPPLAEVFRDELEQLERAREAGMEVWKP